MACLPIGKKIALHAFVGQRLEHRRRGRPRAVVEGQHDFVVAQEVVLLEMLEAEARAAGGVDLDGAGHAERIRIVALAPRTSRRRRGASGRLGAAAGAVARPGRARSGQRRRRPAAAPAGGGPLSRSRSEDQQRRRNRQSKRCRTTHLQPPRNSRKMNQPRWLVPPKLRAMRPQVNEIARRCAAQLALALIWKRLGRWINSGERDSARSRAPPISTPRRTPG